MKTIRIIRAVDQPAGNGPRNGQYALQRALRANNVRWLKIGGVLQPEEIPWVWSWKDWALALECNAEGRPFVLGPNVLFCDSRKPCQHLHERSLCDAGHCRLMFTESAWYLRLIERHRGPRNRAPVALWSYPIEPKPGPPLEADYDLLIYAKSGYSEALIAELQGRWPRSVLLRYRGFERRDLFAAARRSRASVYLSDDDRGPLALLEIMMAGCPAVGIERGAPFIVPGLGWRTKTLEAGELLSAVGVCHGLDRLAVARLARMAYSTERTVDTVLAALGDVAGDLKSSHG